MIKGAVGASRLENTRGVSTRLSPGTSRAHVEPQRSSLLPENHAEGRSRRMLSAARDSKRSLDTGDLLVQIKLGAWAGFELATLGYDCLYRVASSDRVRA
jgi:hypothetical protein